MNSVVVEGMCFWGYGGSEGGEKRPFCSPSMTVIYYMC